VVLVHEDCANLSRCCHFKGRSFQVHTMNKLSSVSLPFIVFSFAINFAVPLLVADLECKIDLDGTCSHVFEI